MMRLTTVKVTKVVVIPLVPSREACLKYLCEEMDIALDQADVVINQSLPLLKKHNRKAANVIVWHYGLGGQNPMSVEKMCRRLKVGKTRLRTIYKGAVKFLCDVHLPLVRLSPPAIYAMGISDFFSRRRIMEVLHEVAPSQRYRSAGEAEWRLHSRFCEYETVGRMITRLKQQPREVTRELLTSRCFVILERLLKAIDIELPEAAANDERKRA